MIFGFFIFIIIGVVGYLIGKNTDWSDSEGNSRGRGFYKDGYNENGFDHYGYRRDGYDSKGFNRERIHKDTHTKYNPEGYDRHGYDRNGYNKDGVHKDTPTKSYTGKNVEISSAKKASEKKEFFCKVTGVTYENRQKIISEINYKTPIKLVRDRTNIYDPYAVEVKTTYDISLGWIPKGLSKIISSLLAEKEEIVVEIFKIVGDGKKYRFGLRLKITYFGDIDNYKKILYYLLNNDICFDLNKENIDTYLNNIQIENTTKGDIQREKINIEDNKMKAENKYFHTGSFYKTYTDSSKEEIKNKREIFINLLDVKEYLLDIITINTPINLEITNIDGREILSVSTLKRNYLGKTQKELGKALISLMKKNIKMSAKIHKIHQNIRISVSFFCTDEDYKKILSSANNTGISKDYFSVMDFYKNRRSSNYRDYQYEYTPPEIEDNWQRDYEDVYEDYNDLYYPDDD